MSAFEISIMTPDRVLFSSTEIKEIVLPTTTGRMGILANHTPLVTGLDIGVMLVSTVSDSNWMNLALLGGFALIKDSKVTIVVSDAEFGSNIDTQEAEKSFLEAKERLEKAEDRKEKIECKLALKRSCARYEASKNRV